MLALNLLVAALFAGVAAQESPASAPADTTTGMVAESSAPAATDASDVPTAVASATGTTGPWNTTYVSFPNREDQGYWVSGTKNKVFWKAVAQPVELRLTNWNQTLLADSPVLASDIPGGQVEHEVDVGNYPPGNNYVVAVWDANQNKKLGQSDGFRIRENGTAPANPGTNPNQPLTGVNPGGNGNTTNTPGGGSDANATSGPNSTDAQPSGPATTTPGSGASRVVVPAALVGGLAAVVALV